MGAGEDSFTLQVASRTGTTLVGCPRCSMGCSGCPSIGHRQQTHLDFKEYNQHPMEPRSGATERAGASRAIPSRAMGERPFKAMEVGPQELGSPTHVQQSCEAGPPRQCWKTGSLRSNGICPTGFGTFLRPVTSFVFSISPFWNEEACPTILYLGSTWQVRYHRLTAGEEFAFRMNLTLSLTYM